MTTVLLFHHAQGQTKGFLGFADELREAGQTVHTPDLYSGETSMTSTKAWLREGGWLRGTFGEA